VATKSSAPILSIAPLRLWERLRAQAWLLGAIALYGLALTIAAPMLGGRVDFAIGLYWKGFAIAGPVIGLVFVLGRAIQLMTARRRDRSSVSILADLRSGLLAPERLAAGLPIFFALPLFLSMFSSFKALIPLIQPFAWDASFAAWDQALHFGRQPWEWLQPLLGHASATKAMNGFYTLWFVALFGVWTWQCFSLRRPVLRMQFLLSFVLVWALFGTGAAALLSSAGPCYFARVTGLADPYAGLMAYLHLISEMAPISALQIQEMLWADYLRPGVEMGAGISAMPSMHVATAVLFALVAWRTDRRLGVGFAAFAAMIQIGSVHLGWHYAIDGYVSIAGTLLVWKAVGWLLARDSRLRTARAPVIAAAEA
jgi:hypothetical protein